MASIDLIESIKEKRFEILSTRHKSKKHIFSWIDSELIAPEYQKDELKKKIKLLFDMFLDESNGQFECINILINKLSSKI